MTKIVSVSLPPDVVKAIKDRAEVENRSFSQMIAMLAMESLNKKAA